MVMKLTKIAPKGVNSRNDLTMGFANSRILSAVLFFIVQTTRADIGEHFVLAVSVVFAAFGAIGKGMRVENAAIILRVRP